MDQNPLTWLEREIGRLRQCHGGYLREWSEARELQALWTLKGNVLHWHVVLEDTVEPDVDVEIVAEALIIRARSLSESGVLLVGLLPVPTGFDIMQPRIRCEGDYLEVQVVRIEGGRR